MPDRIERLIDQLETGDANARAVAVWSLGRLADERAAASLIAHFRDPDRFVRLECVEALGRLGALAVPALVAALEESDLRPYAASALATLGDERAVEPLIEALQQPSWDYRWEAAEGLGKLRAEAAVGPLLQALQDRDAGVRAMAAWSLGEIGDERARPALEHAGQDEDADAREAARKALVRLMEASAAEA
jgi:HEAT repeat protein